MAAWNGHIRVVQQLLERGASVHAANAVRMGVGEEWNGARPPFPLTVSPQDGMTPLMYAARDGHSMMAKLLLQHGARVDERNEADLGNTPLMYAAMKGRKRVLQSLLTSGAQLDLVNEVRATRRREPAG